MKLRNLLNITIILVITLVVIIFLPFIPNYLKEPTPDKIVGFQPKFIIIFLVFDIIAIGIPAFIHKVYIPDYTPIKRSWFFGIFGGVTGGLLGEVALGASFFLIIPYTILMFIYAQFYKRFTWWKVALTTYLGGVVVENVINRSPIQVPTLVWIAFFTYPYFWTKIFENRSNFPVMQMLKDLIVPFIVAVILASLAFLLGTRSDNISPPLIFIGATLPFVVFIPVKLIKHSKK